MLRISKLYIAVSAACAAMALCAPAQAYVYSTSALRVNAFALTATSGTATTTGYSYNLTNSASMNSAPVASGAACNSLGAPACGVAPLLNAAVVNAPGSTALRAENTFGFAGSNGVDSYSNADSVITSATTFLQIAESLLNTNGFAAANSLTQTNTRIDTTLAVGATGADVNLEFLADPDQMAEIGGAAGAYLSQSDLNVTYTLNGAGGSISWTPGGTAGNDCTVIGLAGVSCTELFDTQDLNFNASTGVNPGLSTNSFEAVTALTAFGIRITGLEAGSYTSTLNANTSTSIVRAVPEPATAGLAGIALAGLCLVGVRRKKV